MDESGPVLLLKCHVEFVGDSLTHTICVWMWFWPFLRLDFVALGDSFNTSFKFMLIN